MAACRLLAAASAFLFATVTLPGSAGAGAANTIQEIVASLDFNGAKQSPGTYGASGSGARFIDNTHFSGSGILNVAAVPEPGAGVFAGAGMLLLAMAWRRRARGPA